MTKREQRVINAFCNCVKNGEFTEDYAITLIEDSQRYGWLSDAAKDVFYEFLDSLVPEEPEPVEEPEPEPELDPNTDPEDDPEPDPDGDPEEDPATETTEPTEPETEPEGEPAEDTTEPEPEAAGGEGE